MAEVSICQKFRAQNYRCKPEYIFFRTLIQNLWKEILIAPINPKSFIGQIKDKLKDNLKKFGVLRMLKKMGELL